ncbi:MAG: AmmeMemoRadiSam system protein B, partial [Candidatus Hydrogenedentes bacterium]|nr:AmmeMemoRadiSam system protein B [Candidatus Hydrogenedentota bacterium]
MKTRPAYVAGSFYPSDPDELRIMVKKYINNVSDSTENENVSCLIVPHAGYIFSGTTAGYGYKRIQNNNPSRIILLGVSHRYRFEGISLYDGSDFDTPLGTVMIDIEFSERLADTFPIGGSHPHAHEHTLETQLPFLQYILDSIPIVPVLFGEIANTQHDEFGRCLANLLSPNDLVIASTDFSHFLDEAAAKKIDQCSINAILAGDTDVLIRGLHNETCSMCGGAAVVAALSCANTQKATCRHLLNYSTSALASGDYDRVV